MDASLALHKQLLLINVIIAVLVGMIPCEPNFYVSEPFGAKL